MFIVIKRDGNAVDFNMKNITNAISKAFDATKSPYSSDMLDLFGLRVTADFRKKIRPDANGLPTVTVEDIQDSVESVLIQAGYGDVAKAYILYRKQREKVRNTKNTLMDYKKTMDGYLKVSDWRVKENSTVTYSVGGLILSNSGAMTANYWLSEVYDEEVARAHRDADIHLHDLSMLTGYCAGWSLKQLLLEGLGGVTGRISSAPAKHLSVLCNQMVNFLGIMQNEWAGAQAFSSFDTYLAPFVKVDNLTYKEVKKCIEAFVFGVNIPSRWGCVDTETEVLSETGFKRFDQLKEGEMIYTWNNGRLELNPVRKVIQKPFKGKLHAYKGRGYNQTVTPNHRVLVKEFNKSTCVIKRSEEIFGAKTPYALPVKFEDSAIPGISLTDDEIKLAAMVYTDGSIEMRNNSVHRVRIFKSPNRNGNQDIMDVCDRLNMVPSIKTRYGFGPVNVYTFYGDNARRIVDLVGSKDSINNMFLRMNKRQAELFLRSWASFDGDDEKMRLQYDNDVIRDQLQQIALLAGLTTYLFENDKAHYVKVRQTSTVTPTSREEVDYDGIVWCPNVENGTAVFRKDGCVYISGQTQAPFSNITLDWTVPDDLAELPAIVGGKEMPFKYKDCKKEMDMVNKAFIETMIEGDANGRGFQYPIPTYSITKDFDWSDTENNRLLFEMTAKYGTPYFSNYVNSDMQPSDIRSMCCRLRLDLRELRKKCGGFFGSGESTGSVGVVTINMPRLAYLSKDEKNFYERLDHLMDIAARSLHTKREVISKLMDEGLYPYTKRYLGNFNNHFSTIGLVGMNEAVLNACWIGKNLTDEKAQRFTKEVLTHMRERLSDYQELYKGELFNLEATPAESTAYRLAKHDKERYPDIVTAGKDGETPYYTNSSHLPVGFTDDIFDALDIQDEFQTLYTSGTVFHAFLGEKLPTWKSAAALVKKIAENYKLPYYTLSPTYSVCKEHGYLTGEQFRCPICGEKTEVYSRITGYYRPLQNWNDGKAQEYKHRKTYEVAHEASPVCDTGCVQAETPEPNAGSDPMESRMMLFTTEKCPNCKTAKKILEGFDYEVIEAEKNLDLVKEFGIMQAPTLVVVGRDGVRNYVNASNIQKFVDAKG